MSKTQLVEAQEQILEALKTRNSNKMELLKEKLRVTPQNKPQFWKALIKVLKSKDSLHTSEDASDFYSDTEGSILDFINKYADLADNKSTVSYSSHIYEELYKNGGFWNASVQNLVGALKPLLNQKDTNKILGDKVTIKDIKNADAGYSFVSNPWVKPQFNFDGDEYEYIRNKDAVENILKYRTALQYTNGQEKGDKADLNEWIRLLMPQYGHRVEVEDLDRNFWVIAQVIGALSSYLFDDNSPIPNLLKKLLDEITQLWENVYFLWLESAAMSQKKNYETRVIFVYYKNTKDTLRPYKTYDNIDDYEEILYDVSETTGDDGDKHYELDIKEEMLNSLNFEGSLDYLYEKYSDDNLFVVPILRIDNYKHNYYSTEIYPIALCRHRSWDSWQQVKLYMNDGHVPIFSLRGCKDLFSNLLSGYFNKIIGLREESYGYEYSCPYHRDKNESGEYTDYYYGTVRIKPEVDIVSTIDGFHINSFNLIAEDAAGDVCTSIVTSENSRRLLTISMKNKDINKNTAYLDFSTTQEHGVKEIETEGTPLYYFNLRDRKHPYKGELISYFDNPYYSKDVIEDFSFKVVKIGDAHPEDMPVSSLVEIKTSDLNQVYNTQVYGDGARYCTAAYPNCDNLKYYSYENVTAIKRNFDSLNERLIQDIGIKEIKRLYLRSGKFTENLLCVTKSGLGYWKGNDGSQWSYGILNDLFIAIKGTSRVEHLGKLNILDGFWNQRTNSDGSETELYKVFKVVDAARFRHLDLSPAPGTIQKINGSWHITENYWWKWMDVNQNNKVVGECKVSIGGDNRLAVSSNAQHYKLVDSDTVNTKNENIMAIQLNKNLSLIDFKDKTIFQALIDLFGGKGSVGVYAIDPKSGSRIFK